VLVQQLVNGMEIGLIYGLLALGLSLAYATTRVVNFAHGEMFTLGAFIALTLQRGTSAPFVAAAATSGLALFLAGFAFAYVVLRRLRSPLARIVATIALGLVTRDGMLLVFGSDSASFSRVYPNGQLKLLGASLPYEALIVMLCTLLLLAGVWLLIMRSRLGIWMRATAQDEELATTGGIPTRMVQSLAFGLAALLAAAAGILVGPTWQVNYGTGVGIALKAFTAATLGGLGNIWGALVGGLLLGLLETLFAAYVSSSLKDLFVFSALLLALVFMPRGVFALRQARIS
jgi:branched-chain amino acid transport system permease protein